MLMRGQILTGYGEYANGAHKAAATTEEGDDPSAIETCLYEVEEEGGVYI